MSSITEKIKISIEGGFNNSIGLSFYRNHHAKFKETGEHKARSVINQIQSLRKMPNLEKMAYVSIGGSIGSELIWILENTKIPQGVLMEMDSYACQLAEESAKRLSPQKHMEVIAGDVTYKMNDLHAILTRARNEGIIDGVIISANAVFHELPYRAKDYKLNVLLDELFWDWQECIFVSREPCKPFNWPERVEINIPDVSSDLLYEFSSDINMRLNFFDRIERCGPSFIEMSSTLAAEVIHKLFYIEDYHHEIQERITSINPDDFVAIVEKLLGKNSVLQTRLNSASFSRKYQELGITARSIKKENLTMPLSFFNIIAQRINI